ncbi:MmcQ/YjbR family DNA-binding protein [soil metagenome]
MATWDDVRAIALALPGVEEGMSRGNTVWKADKFVVWDRPLRQRDRDELGEAAPDGEIMGAAVADEGEKRALIAADPEQFFTTDHFNGYAMVLVKLGAIDRDRLVEIVTDAWRAATGKEI